MADVRIKDLGTEATSLNTTDFLVTDTTVETKKISPANIAKDLHSKAVTAATAKTSLDEGDNVLLDDGGTLKKIAGNYIAQVNNWGNPKGGVILDGVDDYYSVANNDNLNFGTGDFSIEMFIKGNALESNNTIAKISSNLGYIFGFSSSTGFWTRLGNGSTYINYIATATLANNKDYHMVMSADRDGNLTQYLNGVPVGTHDMTSLIGVGISTSSALNMFADSYLSATCYLIKFYNRALTQAEVTKYYNNGRPDLAELDYADKGASQTALTSGTLVIGKRYKIDTFVAGDDFTNVATVESGTINTSGCVFIAKATTPTTWTNSSSLRAIGCVAEYKGDGFGAMGLIDSSGNGLHGTSAGNPIALSKKKDYYKTVSTTAVQLVNTQKAGTILKQVKIKNITATPLTASLSTLNTLIATTSANNTLLNAVSVGASETKIFNIGDSAYSYASALRSLYVISSVATSLEVTLIYEEIE